MPLGLTAPTISLWAFSMSAVLLQCHRVVCNALGVDCANDLPVGLLNVRSALAEEDSLAAHATGWLSHNRPLVALRRPLQELVNLARLDLLGSGHAALAELVLHRRLLYALEEKVGAIGGGHFHSLGEVLRQLHAHVRCGDDRLDVVGKGFQVLDELIHIITVIGEIQMLV